MQSFLYSFSLYSYAFHIHKASGLNFPQMLPMQGQGSGQQELNVKAKLQFLAPSAVRSLVMTQSGCALPGIEPTPPDCSGFKVRGLHHCATTPSFRNSETSSNVDQHFTRRSNEEHLPAVKTNSKKRKY